MKNKLQCKTVLKHAGDEALKEEVIKEFIKTCFYSTLYKSHDPQTFIQVHIKDEPPCGKEGGGIKQNQRVAKKDTNRGEEKAALSIPPMV